MARLGWVIGVGVLTLGAAADSGLTPRQQLELQERVERLEQDVARLKSACRLDRASGGLRSEDYGGHSAGGASSGPQQQLSPQQQEQLLDAAQKLRQQAEQYKSMMQQLENSQ